MGYFKESLVGAGWMGALRVLTRALSFLKIAIMARILSPEDFGIFGIAIITLAFLETFTETGIYVFFIQEDKDIDEYIDSAWILSIIRGIVIGTFIFIGSTFIANFFNAPSAIPLLRLASLVAIIRGFINPAILNIQKHLLFRKEFKIRSIITASESISTVIIALLTHSANSLVLGMVISALVEVLLSFVVIRPLPAFALRLDKTKLLIKRGRWVTLGGVLGYLTRQGDDAVVAKLLNTQALGLYQMAYRLAMLPGTEITEMVNKVTFPVYTKIAGDRQRLMKAYRKTLLSLSFLVIPIGLFLIIFPEIAIRIILGDQWLGSASALRILAVFGAIGALIGSRNPMLFALKRQDIASKITLVRFLVLAALIVPLTLRNGIEGAAIAALISVIVIVPLTEYYVWKISAEK